MKSKRLWTLAAAAVVLLTVTIAAHGDDFVVYEPGEINPDLGMFSTQPSYPFEGLAHFVIDVPPEYVGGHAEVTVEILDTGEEFSVMPFDFVAPNMEIDAPVVGLPGQMLSYSYVATGPSGEPLGRRRPLDGKIVEPEWE